MKNKIVKTFEDYSNKFDINKNDYQSVISALENIEQLEKDEYGFGKYITSITNRQGNYCEIRLRESYDDKIADGFGDSKLEAIYNCVLDFYENIKN